MTRIIKSAAAVLGLLLGLAGCDLITNISLKSDEDFVDGTDLSDESNTPQTNYFKKLKHLTN